VTLLDATYELVQIDSVSGKEDALATRVVTTLSTCPWLRVERIGDNVVARTEASKPRRILIAGHLDTVPGDVSRAVKHADHLVGLGACDMKGSLAVMLDLAARNTDWTSDVTWVFYAREEIARRESGLLEIENSLPELLVGDVAILGEPTGGAVEAGCQGTLQVEVVLQGQRAHTARPFMGRNAIHRQASLISRVASYVPREVDIDGVTFTEQTQVVSVRGGVALNVVPDSARCVINHRVAPDRTFDEAMKDVVTLFEDLLEPGDTVTSLDWAPPAPPSLQHEVLAHLVQLTKSPARAKVGYTDVSFFFERGIPATNFGAGDPLLAHHLDEQVSQAELSDFAEALERLLSDTY